MIIGLPFFCRKGWDFSLSLRKELEGAACVILRWISFALWNARGPVDAAGIHIITVTAWLTPASDHCFVQPAYFDCVLLSDRVEPLYCFFWKCRKRGNIYLLEMHGFEFVVVWCSFVSELGIIQILSRCWRKIAKTFIKMDTVSLKLPLK